MKSQVPASSPDRLSTLSELCQVISMLRDVEPLSPEAACDFAELSTQHSGQEDFEFVPDSADTRADTEVERLTDMVLDRGDLVN